MGIFNINPLKGLAGNEQSWVYAENFQSADMQNVINEVK